MKAIDWINRKIAFVYLKFSEWMVNSIVFFYSVIYKRKQNAAPKKSIIAYWCYPPDLTGSDIRIGAWKKYFNEKGCVYDNYYINNFDEAVREIEKGSWANRYYYFAKSFWRRLPQMLVAHRYDTIWLQRVIIPFYPRKSAFLERRLKKVVRKLVVDTTDGGDYKSNPSLMEQVFSAADEVTVGYKYLKEFYEDRFKVTQVFWTIPTDNYIVKTSVKLKSVPVIGWMGSPGNFQYVRGIIPQLQALAKTHEFVFKYICRKNFDKELVGIKTEHHFYDENYYKTLSEFDIGISPSLIEDLSTKGKIAMKHLEFLLMGTPQVCSSVAMSEFVVDGEHVKIAKTIEEWHYKLTELLEHEELRNNLNLNSIKLFNEYYTYESQFDKLYKIHTE